MHPSRLRQGPGPRNLARSFTLVELLVVVAIISVLAAMLMPSLRGSREKAKSMQCASNLRQLAVALQLYAGEYGGILPKYWDNSPQYQISTGNNKSGWTFRLEPYIGRVGRRGTPIYVGDEPRNFNEFSPVLRCPAAYPIVISSLNGEVTMYAINANLATAMSVQSPSIGSVRSPASIILLADSAVSNVGNQPGQDLKYTFGYGDAYATNPFVDPGSFAWHAYTHLVNCVFMDGHVEIRDPSKITQAMIIPK